MSVFEKMYQDLNKEQRLAVNTIDGPLLVIAGPGSGKTQLLSMRVANILRQTDTLPQSILCLTFTDSGCINMRKRLRSIIKNEAFKVQINTFHSLATDIINRYPEYFFQQASFELADEITKISILQDIFESLKYNDPLAKYHPDQGWVYLSDIKKALGGLKQAGLTPQEFKQILDYNQQFLEFAKNPVCQFFSVSNIKSIKPDDLSKLKNEILDFDDSNQQEFLHKMNLLSLKQSFLDKINVVENDFSSQNLMQLRSVLCKKDEQKEWQLKDNLQLKKHYSLAFIYEKYQQKLWQRALYDFDDMILQLVLALENNPDLQANCQEQFLYILVDEFQDTNGVQNRLIDNLINTEVTNNRPNLMGVGDDDQAVFKFQGASLANMMHFKEKYDDVKIVSLTKNYRSTQQILDFAIKVIEMASHRLTELEGVDKKLVAQRQ